jgi:hypothetical protein
MLVLSESKGNRLRRRLRLASQDNLLLPRIALTFGHELHEFSLIFLCHELHEFSLIYPFLCQFSIWPASPGSRPGVAEAMS